MLCRALWANFLSAFAKEAKMIWPLQQEAARLETNERGLAAAWPDVMLCRVPPLC